MEEDIEFNADEQKEIKKTFEAFAAKGGYINPRYAEDLKNYLTAMALISLCTRLVGEGDYDNAERSLYKSLKVYPLPDATYLLAQVCFKTQEIKKSIQLFKHFLEGVEIIHEESQNNPVLKAYLDFSTKTHPDMVKTAKETIKLYEENLGSNFG